MDTTLITLLVPVAGVLALGYAFLRSQWVSKQDPEAEHAEPHDTEPHHEPSGDGHVECLGQPAALADEMLQEILSIQERVRALVKPGTPCAEVHREGDRAFKASRFAGGAGRFVAHGLGMVTHEPPVIDPENSRPLEAGMVLSIETDFEHPEVGRVKIEDTVVVTADGAEGLGDLGRSWTIV